MQTRASTSLGVRPTTATSPDRKLGNVDWLTGEEIMTRVLIFSLVVLALAAAPALSKRFRAAPAVATEIGLAP
jgi:hypothetical protein